ncbi:heparan-alpha-glucosaminide N-acetyltransferase-like [Mytilus trossulus]|uniref:heparan-alpha-glucosaminide N-acetyltransferase-like n=1 Tax=Mytilus trossulus TaxID=6551 RepID=UPI0030059B24
MNHISPVMLVLISMLYFVSVVNADHHIRYAELHSNDFLEHGLDEGWLTINASSNWIIKLYALNDECWKCPFVHVTTIPDTASQMTLPVNTTFGTTIVLKRKHPSKDIEEDFCRFHKKFTEGGNYWLFVDDETYKSEECDVLLINHPLPAEMPILYVFLVLCALPVLIVLAKFVFGKARKSSSLDVTEPSTKSKKDLKLSSHHTKSQAQDNGQTTEVEIQPEESSSTKDHKRTRLKSLDTFRGLSLVVMIFVNYGGGGYWFFDHPPWNGLTVADLVFPWFIFIMGTSMNFSFKGMIRRNNTKCQILLKIIKRSALLFAFGIILNTNWGPVDLEHIRIPGVLQRFSLTYLVLAIIELIFIRNYNIPKERSCAPLNDILSLAPQWIISLGILAAYVGLTLKLEFPGCPTGYIGPGGLHDGGKHYNCTGGAAQYIDVLVLGKNHIYGNPTPKKIYQTTAPHDPEGILGTLTSIFLCFLGLQAGRILICFQSHKERIIRWIIWGVLTGVVGAVLCKGSQNDGWVPLNKNLWSISFILVTASFAFLLLSAMYITIDILKIWEGDPFIYPGMNSIVVYCCHDIFYRFFPVNWQIHDDHLSLLLKAVWDTSIYVVLAYVMFKKKIFVAL